MAALGLAQAVDLGEEAVLDVLLPFHVARQHVAGVGRHQTASAPLEQGHAAIALQRGDGPADGGGVHVQQLGRAAEPRLMTCMK